MLIDLHTYRVWDHLYFSKERREGLRLYKYTINNSVPKGEYEIGHSRDYARNVD